MTETTTSNLIRTPFGFHSTSAEVIEGIELSGKRAIVTGGSSGVGVETARALASAAAEVTLAVRDTDAGERAAAVTATTGNPEVHVGRLDSPTRRRSQIGLTKSAALTTRAWESESTQSVSDWSTPR